MRYPGWLKRFRERLQIPREWSGDLSAVYWEGSPDCVHPVRQITMKGAHVETATTWPRGTMILINLRHRPQDERAEQAFAGLWSVVARSEPGGLWIDFVFSDPSERRKLRRFLRTLDATGGHEHKSEAEDEKTVWRARFIRRSERG